MLRNEIISTITKGLAGAYVQSQNSPSLALSVFMKFLRLPLVSSIFLVACVTGEPFDTETDTDSVDTGPVVQDDMDEDTILDVHEGNEDVDGDGRRTRIKTRTGITYATRWKQNNNLMTLPIDSDGDGTPDFLDLIPITTAFRTPRKPLNRWGAVDTDGDSLRDIADPDNDGDGIDDVWEIAEPCDEVDSDGDGTADYLDEDWMVTGLRPLGGWHLRI